MARSLWALPPAPLELLSVDAPTLRAMAGAARADAAYWRRANDEKKARAYEGDAARLVRSAERLEKSILAEAS